MRRVAAGELSGGEVLARSVCNERGQVLLGAGIALNARHVSFLREHGYAFVVVEEQLPPDLDLPGLVRERVERRITPGWAKLLGTIEQRYGEEHVALAVGGEPAGRPDGRAVGRVSLTALRAWAEAIVNRALDREVAHALVELRDHVAYAFVHALDVAVTALLVGRRLALEPDDLLVLARGCLLHDVGLIAIDGAVLNRAGPLTAEEWQRVCEHPAHGYERVKGIPGTGAIEAHMAFQHHERQDGQGYPRGLTGTNVVGRRGFAGHEAGRILFQAEILAVANAFEALGSPRPYRPAHEPERVVELLREMAGSALNREIVHLLLSVAPVYPIGTQVVLLGGQFHDFRGVVCGRDPVTPELPVVRLALDNLRRRIVPIDVDLANSDSVAMPWSS